MTNVVGDRRENGSGWLIFGLSAGSPSKFAIHHSKDIWANTIRESHRSVVSAAIRNTWISVTRQERQLIQNGIMK